MTRRQSFHAYLQHIEQVRRTEILGCPVDVLSLAGTVEAARQAIASGEAINQVSINGLKVGLAHSDQAFGAALRSFDLAGADGVSVVWASKLLGTPLPGRVNGTDLMLALLELAEQEDFAVYVLGAKQETLDAAAAEVRRRWPRLRLAGTRHGYFNPEDEAEVVREVAASGADILFLAFPSPRKEWFLLEYAERLGVGFAVGVGGSIDVLAGIQRRAPLWMQRAGLEWFFRLVRDPAGMWRRYLTTNTRFLVLLARAVVARGIRALR